MEKFAGNLQKYRTIKGLKQKEVADLVGVGFATWSDYERGKSQPSLSVLNRISEVLHVSLDDLVKNNAPPIDVLETTKIPMKSTPKSTPNSTSNTEINPKNRGIPLIPIDSIAGWTNGDIQVKESDIMQWYYVPEFVNMGATFLIPVKGVSMSPLYLPGDLLACKKVAESFIQWGKAYVLDTEQGAIVKRIFPGKDDKHLQCCSDNSEKFPPYQINKNDVRSVCLVIGLIRFE